MQYSLAHQLGKRSGGLDPDAKAYIAAVETAGATVTSGQKKAINTFVKTGKSDGWYSSLKRMYLPIWASAAPNAVDMITRASGTFSGTVTHSAGYVKGDGSTGYFAVDDTLHDIIGDTSLASIIRLQLNNSGGINYSGAFVSTNRLLLGNNGSGTTTTGTIGRNTIFATGGFSVGVLVAARTSNTSLIVHGRDSSGFSSGTEVTTLNDLNIPNIAPYFAGGANNNSSLFASPAPAEEGAYGVGDALTTSQSEAFSLALKNLWETSTGLTLEGAEYISTIRAAGATVTATQETAIHDFIRTGKSDGWWSSLKRLYLPIWASAAPNAIDMIGLTSGTFNGTVTHSAGYVQGNGSTGYFDTGDSATTKGLTTSSGSMGALMYDSGLNADWLMGAISSGLSRSGIFHSAIDVISHYNLSSTSSEARTPSSGILLFSRDSGNRTFYERDSTGFTTVGSTAGADAGTVSTHNDYLLGVNSGGTAVGFTPVQLGAAFWGLGLDATESEDFTLALKDLWETSTGLTLP